MRARLGRPQVGRVHLGCRPASAWVSRYWGKQGHGRDGLGFTSTVSRYSMSAKLARSSVAAAWSVHSSGRCTLRCTGAFHAAQHQGRRAQAHHFEAPQAWCSCWRAMRRAEVSSPRCPRRVPHRHRARNGPPPCSPLPATCAAHRAPRPAGPGPVRCARPAPRPFAIRQPLTWTVPQAPRCRCRRWGAGGRRSPQAF